MSKLKVQNLVKGTNSLDLTLSLTSSLSGGEGTLSDICELDDCHIQFKVISMYWTGDAKYSFFLCSKVVNESTLDYVVTIYVGESKVTLNSSNVWIEIYQLKDASIFEIKMTVSWALWKKNPLKSIYTDDMLLDFKIFVGKEEESNEGRECVSFHRAVLSAWSPVFLKMFSGTWKEKDEGEVKLPLNIEVIEAFKKYIYTDELPTDQETLLGLVEMGSYYMIPKLETEAIKALACITDTNNFYELLEYSFVKKLNNLTGALLIKCKTVDKKIDIQPIVKKIMTLDI